MQIRGSNYEQAKINKQHFDCSPSKHQFASVEIHSNRARLPGPRAVACGYLSTEAQRADEHVCMFFLVVAWLFLCLLQNSQTPTDRLLPWLLFPAAVSRSFVVYWSISSSWSCGPVCAFVMTNESWEEGLWFPLWNNRPQLIRTAIPWPGDQHKAGRAGCALLRKERIEVDSKWWSEPAREGRERGVGKWWSDFFVNRVRARKWGDRELVLGKREPRQSVGAEDIYFTLKTSRTQSETKELLRTEIIIYAFDSSRVGAPMFAKRCALFSPKELHNYTKVWERRWTV